LPLLFCETVFQFLSETAATATKAQRFARAAIALALGLLAFEKALGLTMPRRS
jgi:hypothetical protein